MLDADLRSNCMRWSTVLKAAEIDHEINRNIMQEYQAELRSFLVVASAPVEVSPAPLGESIRGILKKYIKQVREQNALESQYKLRGALLAVTFIEVIRCVGTPIVYAWIEECINSEPTIADHYYACTAGISSVNTADAAGRNKRRRGFVDSDDNFLRFLAAAVLNL